MLTRLDQIVRAAVLAAYRGERVSCSRQQYGRIRPALVEAIRWLVDEGDEESADQVLTEIFRLDTLHDYEPERRTA